ncbi:hypothetical protein Q5M85_14020 [Paraclostridium bifermentans]|nr:hypothetical protein [Paraclostridium bifermentans]
MSHDFIWVRESTFGTNEETLPFYMIFILLNMNLGTDSLTAIKYSFQRFSEQV